MPTFGENLRSLRTSRGYSQDKFGKILGTNQINISAWEIGSRKPSLATIKHIAETFRVPLSSLISVSDTGNADDFSLEVADVMSGNPKIRLLFDRTKYLSDSDLDAVIGIVNAITRRREDNA